MKENLKEISIKSKFQNIIGSPALRYIFGFPTAYFLIIYVSNNTTHRGHVEGDYSPLMLLSFAAVGFITHYVNREKI